MVSSNGRRTEYRACECGLRRVFELEFGEVIVSVRHVDTRCVATVTGPIPAEVECSLTLTPNDSSPPATP